MKAEKDISKLESIIEYKFNNIELLNRALMHSSYSNDKKMGKLNNNERLEFLGDAVLELCSSKFLFNEYPNKTEGELTKLRSSIVCEPTLAMCAREISLHKFIILGHGEEYTGGRYRDSICSDAMEAVIGALYLDGGFDTAYEFVKKFVLNDIENKQLFYDSKTILQEIVQKTYKTSVEYNLLNEIGPDHNKEFEVNVTLNEMVLGTGKGRTKRKAEQQAAYEAILYLNKLDKQRG